MNEFEEYQKEARKTASYPNRGNNLIYPILGLCGESGEVAEKLKKLIRDHSSEVSEEFKKSVMKELGDVLWYLSTTCDELKTSLSEVAKLNIEKLKDRKKRGVIKGSGDNR